MFQKLVAIEPISLNKKAEAALSSYAKEVVMFDDIPKNDAEIISRIGDADGVLLSYTSAIGAHVLKSCPNIKYIGMCCSLYSPQSANVDILTAQKMGITVLGIRDYGDEGVVEYVLSELVRFLHGFGEHQWKELPLELTNLKVGIVGLGTSGQMIANGLSFFGSDIYYYSRTRKVSCEEKGMTYLPLHDLLKTVDVVFTCLNKNIVLMGEKEFEILGGDKIMFNTSISPSHELPALERWLNKGNTYFFCDTIPGIGSEELAKHHHVFCVQKSSGRTAQAFDRLSEKVLNNMDCFLKG